jgi:hypothetical protein
MTITGRMDKENMVHVCNEILLNYEEKWKSIICVNMQGTEDILLFK